MGSTTKIPWTDHTFNLAWGCQKVSPGCTHCYAERLARRYGYDVFGPDKPRRTLGAAYWDRPRQWNAAAEKEGRAHRIFCASMADPFENHPTIAGEREKLWALIRASPWLDWQLLTKRPERIAETLPDDWHGGYDNVWLGTSIENNDYVWRADELRKIPAVVRFVSYEPALGPLGALELEGIDWVIYGGESGPGYRKHQPTWARNMYARCRSAGVAFFFKQSSGTWPETGILLDGQLIREFPEGGRRKDGG